MSSISNGETYIKFTPSKALNEEKQARLERFLRKFQQKTLRKLDYVICAPGRVNLIGDHIDYHGFAVLPMAIKNCIWLGCSLERRDKDTHGDGLASSKIDLFNNDPDNYTDWTGPHSFVYGSGLDKSHRWHHYVLCGYHGVLATRMGIKPDQVLEHVERMASDKELLAFADKCLGKLKPFALLIDSDLPSASGLSSSSALVCASAVATNLLYHHSTTTQDYKLDAMNKLINGQELAHSCSKFEHLIGTRGGGMDQAVIMTAQEGYAKYVEFMPRLKCDNVHLPRNTVWLVSHCGFSYPKAATSGFNTRVLETKLGAAMIAKAHGASKSVINNNLTLGKVKNDYFASMPANEIVKHLRTKVFNNTNEFSVSDICQALGITREEMKEIFKTNDKFLKDELNDKLQLLLRCEHVFEEAERVERFKSVCDTTADTVWLGQLMTQSHYSLRDKYDCSHPALDRMVSVALDAGALGSRLTGAGWGGCVVTIVEAAKSNTVFDRLKEVSKFTFRTEPMSGCEVICIEDQTNK